MIMKVLTKEKKKTEKVGKNRELNEVTEPHELRNERGISQENKSQAKRWKSRKKAV